LYPQIASVREALRALTEELTRCADRLRGLVRRWRDAGARFDRGQLTKLRTSTELFETYKVAPGGTRIAVQPLEDDEVTVLDGQGSSPQSFPIVNDDGDDLGVVRLEWLGDDQTLLALALSATGDAYVATLDIPSGLFHFIAPAPDDEPDLGYVSTVAVSSDGERIAMLIKTFQSNETALRVSDTNGTTLAEFHLPTTRDDAHIYLDSPEPDH
jgi:hypothetical protein